MALFVDSKISSWIWGKTLLEMRVPSWWRLMCRHISWSCPQKTKLWSKVNKANKVHKANKVSRKFGISDLFPWLHFQRLRYRHQSTSFGFGTHRSCVLTVIQRCKPGKGFRNERQCCFSSKVHTVAILSQFLKERLHMTNDWKAKNKQSERTSSKQRTKSRQCNWSFLQVPGELKDVWPPYSRALKSYRWLKHSTCYCRFISGIGE